MSNLAYKDAQTNIYNRRYINSNLAKTFIRSQIKNENYYLLMFEVEETDSLVEKVCESASKYIRDGKDWIARYSNNEFILMVSGDTDNNIMSTAREIKSSIDSESGTNLKFGLSRLDSVHTEIEIKNVIKGLDKAKKWNKDIIWEI